MGGFAREDEQICEAVSYVRRWGWLFTPEDAREQVEGILDLLYLLKLYLDEFVIGLLLYLPVERIVLEPVFLERLAGDDNSVEEAGVAQHSC